MASSNIAVDGPKRSNISRSKTRVIPRMRFIQIQQGMMCSAGLYLASREKPPVAAALTLVFAWASIYKAFMCHTLPVPKLYSPHLRSTAVSGPKARLACNGNGMLEIKKEA